MHLIPRGIAEDVSVPHTPPLDHLISAWQQEQVHADCVTSNLQVLFKTNQRKACQPLCLEEQWVERELVPPHANFKQWGLKIHDNMKVINGFSEGPQQD